MADSEWDVVVVGGGRAGAAAAELAVADGHRTLLLEIRRGDQATALREAAGRITGVRYADAAGVEHEVSTRFVVDASGLWSRLQLSPVTRTTAVFACFEGCARPPEPGTVHFGAIDRGWLWYAPLTGELTSVGVVVAAADTAAVHVNADAALHALISQCPQVYELLRGARRAEVAPHGDIRVREDLTAERALWRPGMVAVGDAGLSPDPALGCDADWAARSAELAMRAVGTALRWPELEAESFAEHAVRSRREFARLLVGALTAGVS